MKHKLYCIFADESVKKMNGIRGKMCTQAGHAYVHSIWDAFAPSFNLIKMFRKIKQAYAYKHSERAYKITLRISTVDVLKAIQEKYKNICGTHLVTDAGFTVFKEPTTTCLGLGPISEDKIGDDLKALKTFT
jgi:peptidyl-tRNA hydrolase